VMRSRHFRTGGVIDPPCRHHRGNDKSGRRTTTIHRTSNAGLLLLGPQLFLVQRSTAGFAASGQQVWDRLGLTSASDSVDCVRWLDDAPAGNRLRCRLSNLAASPSTVSPFFWQSCWVRRGRPRLPRQTRNHPSHARACRMLHRSADNDSDMAARTSRAGVGAGRRAAGERMGKPMAR